MKVRRLLLVTLGWLILSGESFSQTQDSYDYNSEFTWGVNKNSSGGLIGGFVFKKARRRSERIFETFGLEVMNVKHPQEVRRSSVIGNFFIFGKLNYLYTFRLQYGRDIVLFKKAPQQGVEVKAVFAAGLSIGLQAPYFIERAIDNNAFITKNEPYDPKNPEHGFSNILGAGNLFQGVGQSQVRLGGNVKAALNFELGFSKNSVSGFEVGFLADAYVREIELLAGAKNSAVFPTVFITLFYGTRK
jgi:hypothetical protein